MIIDPLEEEGGECEECGRVINDLAFSGAEVEFFLSQSSLKLCNRCLQELGSKIERYPGGDYQEEENEN